MENVGNTDLMGTPVEFVGLANCTSVFVLLYFYPLEDEANSCLQADSHTGLFSGKP